MPVTAAAVKASAAAVCSTLAVWSPLAPLRCAALASIMASNIAAPAATTLPRKAHFAPESANAVPASWLDTLAISFMPCPNASMVAPVVPVTAEAIAIWASGSRSPNALR
ncbi:hypothetical protein D3C85_1358790 [compost metagenome]